MLADLFEASSWHTRAPGVFCIAAALVATELTAQQGAISGTVTDAESLRPISGVQVFLEGTAFGGLTNAEGLYRLEGIAAGAASVTVRLIGYRETTLPVNVVAGTVVTLDFAIEQTALRLQDLVVTGVVGETPKVKLPFTVERIDAADMPVPASNLSTLLIGKVPGMTVGGTSGQPGQTGSFMARGPTSLNTLGRSQKPLIVIDGVIQSDGATLADIGTMDIDHVEIVKGAAAASLYGSRAQAGVIEITTKRGSSLPGGAELLIRGEFGVSNLLGNIGFETNHPYVMNEAGTKFIDTEGNEVDYSAFSSGESQPVIDGETPFTTFQDGIFPGTPYNNLERFFDPGQTWSGYASVSRRSGPMSFRASAERYRETGIVDCGDACRNPLALENFGEDFAVRDDGFDRSNVRLNMDMQAGNLDIAVSGFFSRSSQDNSATAGSIFRRLVFANQWVDYTAPDEEGLPHFDPDALSAGSNPLYVLAVKDDARTRSRVMGSLDSRWSLTPWLTLEANASYDRTDLNSSQWVPKDFKQGRDQDGNPATTGGSLTEFDLTEEATNASLTLSSSRRFLNDDLVVRARARALVESQDYHTRGIQGSQFAVDDVPNFTAITGVTDATNETTAIRSNGVFAIASADYRDRYILDGLIRRDGSSLFGPSERWHTYLRGSAAWRVSQESFWNVDWIDELKLRASIGTAGGRPNFFAQYETYEISAGAIFPDVLGNRLLKPEHSTEREFGVDLVFFDNLALDVTHARNTIDDQLQVIPLAAFTGFSSGWANAGEIKSNTWEVSVRWAAIDRPDMGLNFRVIWDRTEATISRLDVPAFRQQGFWYDVGEPLGQYWQSGLSARSCQDVIQGLGVFEIAGFDCAQFQVNDEGYAVWVGSDADYTNGISKGLWGTSGEVSGHPFDWGMPVRTKGQSRTCLKENPEDRGVGDVCLLQESLPTGNTQPDWSAAFATAFRYKGFSVNALFDATIGFDLWNENRNTQFRFLSGPDWDQAHRPEGLRKPLAYYNYFGTWVGTRFFEPGGWVKLRELAIGYTLPTPWVERTFGGVIDRATFNLIGRNLLTFTNYSGFDPDAGVDGGAVGSATIDRWDAFQYPNSRLVSVALELVF